MSVWRPHEGFSNVANTHKWEMFTSLMGRCITVFQGFIGLANERRRYIVTLPFIGWAHTQNDSYVFHMTHGVSPNLHSVIDVRYPKPYEPVAQQTYLSESYPHKAYLTL